MELSGCCKWRISLILYQNQFVAVLLAVGAIWAGRLSRRRLVEVQYTVLHNADADDTTTAVSAE
jgi:hypothetical protein